MKKAALPSILIAVVLLALGVIAEAQQTGKVPRIGYLTGATPDGQSARIEAFRQGLRELGYIIRQVPSWPMVTMPGGLRQCLGSGSNHNGGGLPGRYFRRVGESHSYGRRFQFDIVFGSQLRQWHMGGGNGERHADDKNF